MCSNLRKENWMIGKFHFRLTNILHTYSLYVVKHMEIVCVCVCMRMCMEIFNGVRCVPSRHKMLRQIDDYSFWRGILHHISMQYIFHLQSRKLFHC